MTDWKKLEDEVDNAINKGCPIDFDSKTIKECEYQQRVAEDRLSWMGVKINIIIFIAAVGTSISIAFIRIIDLQDLIGYLFGIFVIIGLILVFKPLMHGYHNCRRIILKAEKRISSGGNIEPTRAQETTNTPQQVQENVPRRRENVGQIEYIKAILDFLKLFVSATLAAMFLIVVYNLQTSGTNVINVNLSLGILGFLLIAEFVAYVWIMLKLKDLP